MTVRELLSRVGSDEITEWAAYFRLDPFGEERADLRAGIVASAIANTMGGGKRTYQPSEFMPKFGEPQSRQMSDDDIKQMVCCLRAAFGGNNGKQDR